MTHLWQDGSILAWKSTSESSSPELVATLKGHGLAVLALVVGANCLYSGSKDESIRVCSFFMILPISGFLGSVRCIIGDLV